MHQTFKYGANNYMLLLLFAFTLAQAGQCPDPAPKRRQEALKKECADESKFINGVEI